MHYRSKHEIQAVLYDGTWCSLEDISKLTTTRVLLSSGNIAAVEVYTEPQSDVDDGYRTLTLDSYVVLDGTVGILPANVFEDHYEGVA